MAIKALEWLRRTEVGSPTRKLVLYAIADRVKDGEWVTWAGQEALAQDTELSPRSVRTILRDLERMGVIERSKRRRPDGYRTSDAIRLNVEWEPTSPAGDSPEAVSPEGDAGCSDQDIPADSHRQEFPGKEFPRKSTSTSPANERQSYRQELPRGDGKLEPEVEPETAPPALVLVPELPSADAVATERFEEHFWPTYPKRNGKRLGKARSLTEWKRLTVPEQRAAVLAARNYAAACTAGLTMAKDPERWLRQRCWPEWEEPATPDRPKPADQTPGAFPEASSRW